MQFEIRMGHRSEVKPGTVILSQGKHRTLCRRDINLCPLMGKTILGDSYKLGTRPVPIVEIFHARPEVANV